MSEGQPPQRRKPRAKITQSPHREEYVELIKAGWNSFALSRYAAYRYGEEIADSTFRAYKSRMKIEVEQSALATVAGLSTDQVTRLDVMTAREELIALQMARIKVDAEHELKMNKLFSSSNREIQLLSTLLDAYKGDQRDFGLLNTPVSETPEQQPTTGGVPRYRSLRELFGDDAIAASRHLADVLPFTPRQEPA
jgi:hypothetical protein